MFYVPSTSRIPANLIFLSSLSLDQLSVLEGKLTSEEIKREVGIANLINLMAVMDLILSFFYKILEFCGVFGCCSSAKVLYFWNFSQEVVTPPLLP